MKVEKRIYDGVEREGDSQLEAVGSRATARGRDGWEWGWTDGCVLQHYLPGLVWPYFPEVLWLVVLYGEYGGKSRMLVPEATMEVGRWLRSGDLYFPLCDPVYPV